MQTQPKLTIYRDCDRYIVGCPEWQTCTSMTDGIAEAYSLRDAKQIVAKAVSLSAAELEAQRRVFWTDGRFEAACEAGAFGPAWD